MKHLKNSAFKLIKSRSFFIKKTLINSSAPHSNLGNDLPEFNNPKL